MHKKSLWALLLILGLVCPLKAYAIDPLETLKSIKDSAVELGESLLKIGKKLPKAVAVLPATGQGEEQDRVEIRTTFSNHIAYKSYENIKITDVDGRLHLLEKEKGKKWHELTPQEIGKAVNSDGLIYVEIVGIEKIYAAVYGSLTLRLKVRLVLSETGETLWEKEDSVTERSGGVPMSPWGAISTAVSSALVLRESVKVALTDKLCRSLAKAIPEPKTAVVKKPPAIFSVVTNALDGPFKAQDEVLVSVTGEEGMPAYFNIGDAQKGIQLAETKPGEYLGKYVVKEGDGWQNQTLTAFLYNARERLEGKYIVPHSITVDTVPPGVIENFKADMVKDGLLLSWTPPKDEDLKDFVVTRGSVDAPAYAEIGVVSVPEFIDRKIEFGKKYYYRTYARDRAKNLSKFNEIIRVAVKQGPTELSGEIKESTALYSFGSPYIIKGGLTVPKGVIVNVEPGTVIEFDKGSVMTVMGGIIAKGGKDAPITVKGKDYQLIFSDAGKGGGVWEYAYFEFGEKISVSNSSVSFANSRFQDFDTAVSLERNAEGSFKNCVFRKNKTALKALDGKLALDGGEIAQNGKGIEVGGASTLEISTIKLAGNHVNIESTIPLNLNEIEIVESSEQDILRKIKGDVGIKRVTPLGKSMAELKKDVLDGLKREFAANLVKDNLIEAKKLAGFIEELFPEQFVELSDAMIYVYFQTGDAKKAKDILGKGKAKAGNQIGRVLGIDDGVPKSSEVVLNFADVKISIAGSAEGLERAGITKAQWRAVKNFIDSQAANLDRDKMAVVNDKIIPKAADYTLAVVPLYYHTGAVRYDAYYMVFLDKEKIQRDLRELRIVGEFKREIKLGIVDCTGLGISKHNLIKNLQALNFLYEDMGTGSPDPSNYYERAKDKEIDVVLLITESVKSSQSLLGGNLKTILASVEVKGHDAYTAKPVLNLAKGANTYHMNEDLGKEIAVKSAFDAIMERLERDLSGIEKMLAGDEKRQNLKKAVYAEKHMPPLEIKVMKTEAVFSNNYKIYAEKPFIALKLINNTMRDFEQLKVSVMMKEYMDYPSEITLERLPSVKTADINITGVFNNRLLELTENSTIQADLKVRYQRKGEEKEVSLAYPVQVYEKHALIWDDRNKIAIYVTPKDPVVVDFSRTVSREIKKRIITQNLSMGLAVFEAVRSLGITYQQDPNNPYQVVSGKAETIDYVQYARETLKRKTGDCDDLVSLFCSLMESLGIKTAAIDYPGHILAMFDSGIMAGDIEKYGFNKDEIIVYDEKAWIPVELTLLTENFFKAWTTGAKNYGENSGANLKFILMEKAWQDYKPATLPAEKAEIPLLSIFYKYADGSLKDVETSRNRQILGYIGENRIKPELSVYSLYKEGALDDAVSLSLYLLDKGVNTSDFLNDTGNLFLIKKQPADALRYYKKALEKDPNNPFYMINTVKALKRLGKDEEAKALREKLKAISPFISE